MAKFATTVRAPVVGVEQFGNDDSIQAQVVPLVELSQRARQGLFEDEKWQQKARRFDREGPGIFGAALDMPAATSTLLELYVRVPSSDGFERVHDATFTSIMRLWRGDRVDQPTMFSRLIRTCDLVGEGYMVLHSPDDLERMHWQLAQTSNVFDKRDGSVDVKSKPTARPGSRWHRNVPNSQVFHFHQSDPEWEGCAWSPMRRGLGHLEKYSKVMRNIGRNVDSQLAMNGVLWSKAISEKTGWQDAIKHWAHSAITKDDGIEGVIPFLMQTVEKPEFIDAGRGDHQEQIMAAEFFLKAFATSTDLPTSLLLEGPGSLNHWGSYLEGDFYADMTMAPRWRRACRIITDTHLRPILRLLNHPDAETAEVWADDHRIRTKTDNSDRVMALDGIASRSARAEVAGLREDQVIKLPPGVSEYDDWLIRNSPQLAAGSLSRETDQDSIAPGLRSAVPEMGEPLAASITYPDGLVPA